MMDPVKAQMLLLKCHGDEIWPEDVCRAAGVPEAWLEELVEQYESGFDTDRNSIYFEGKLVNQFRGVSDLMLACKLADYLGIDWTRTTTHCISRTQKVTALQEALDEI